MWNLWDSPGLYLRKLLWEVVQYTVQTMQTFYDSFVFVNYFIVSRYQLWRSDDTIKATFPVERRKSNNFSKIYFKKHFTFVWCEAWWHIGWLCVPACHCGESRQQAHCDPEHLTLPAGHLTYQHGIQGNIPKHGGNFNSIFCFGRLSPIRMKNCSP